MFESDSALYWRRRGVAIASVVAVVLLLVWAMSGPGDSTADDQAAESLSTAGVSLQSPGDTDPVPPAGEPVPGSAQPAGVTGQPGAAVPAQVQVPGQPGATGALPAAGLPAAGLPAAGLPAGATQPGALPAAGPPAAGTTQPGTLPAAGLPASGTAGLPANGTAGLPANGVPQTGALPSNGVAAGLPANAARGAIPNGVSPNAVNPKATNPNAASPNAASPNAASRNGAGTQAVPGTAGQRSAQQPAVSGHPGAATTESQRAKAAKPAAPAKPTAVTACSDKAISVQAQTGAESYKVGQKPRFQLMVTNVGSTPCTRNLDPGLQEMVVTGPNKARLWSSNDCFPAKRSEVRTLQPGKPQVFPVDWAGRTSSPGCSGERTSIGPGSYVLTAKLGSLTSGPAKFTMVK